MPLQLALQLALDSQQKFVLGDPRWSTNYSLILNITGGDCFPTGVLLLFITFTFVNFCFTVVTPKPLGVGVIFLIARLLLALLLIGVVQDGCIT